LVLAVPVESVLVRAYLVQHRRLVCLLPLVVVAVGRKVRQDARADVVVVVEVMQALIPVRVYPCKVSTEVQVQVVPVEHPVAAAVAEPRQ
jgi:hypothetical protein